ncbi:AAA family ATPase [Paraburkholderia sp. Ac-20340]|uniref:AAA family ATPase n=1 Tax=Paraburkholderia sp. Ac-20340 TaxID=2703888 RepID=UPI00197F5D83|nr:AAA family ATPase [Paraburkholderia sp. Ac-20340]MBN3851860.1 AAA family ATPase [Paraburkholderia sp. Ac-20340]
MKSLGLKNIRSFKNSGLIDLAPITLLLGQNSSGKSTFLRTFALFKQALGVRAREPFLWVGELVDFGGFSETISKFADENSVSVTIKFDTFLDALLETSRAVFNRQLPQDSRITEFTVSITEYGPRNNGCLESFGYDFHFDGNEISFELNADGTFERFEINGQSGVELVKDWLGVREWNGPIPTFTRLASSESFGSGATADLKKQRKTYLETVIDFVGQRMDGRSREERHRDVAYRLLRSSIHSLLAVAQSDDIGDATWRRAAANWNEDSAEFKKLKNIVIGTRFPEITAHIFDYFESALENIKYVSPLRASAERYYRKQGLAVNELDPTGKNFALFLDNMSAGERYSFSKWTRDFFGISIQTSSEQGGHLSLLLRSSEDNSKEFNMADTGFGFSQMFPILAQLWAIQNKRVGRKNGGRIAPVIFAIEQPELHLHPRLQAQLADVFVSAIVAARAKKIDIRVIVETHSEYLVNRLGSLIGTGKIASKDASVLIFEKNKFSSPTDIRHSDFSEKGFLRNWPHGFFEPV